jgi:hypothetical protein
MIRGGMKESGIGRENGLEAFEACESSCMIEGVGENKFCAVDTQSKSTIINIATVEETRKNDDWFADTDEARRYG